MEEDLRFYERIVFCANIELSIGLSVTVVCLKHDTNIARRVLLFNIILP